DRDAFLSHLGDVGRDRGHVRPLNDFAAELDDDRLGGLAARVAHGQPPGSSSVVRSSSPSLKFIDWIAWPAPPLIKLSVTQEQATTRLPGSAPSLPPSRPTSAKFVPLTAATSGRRFAGTRTNGSFL